MNNLSTDYERILDVCKLSRITVQEYVKKKNIAYQIRANALHKVQIIMGINCIQFVL